MHGEASHYFIEAMKLYISQLIKKKTWKRIKYGDIPLVSNGKNRKSLNGIRNLNSRAYLTISLSNIKLGNGFMTSFKQKRLIALKSTLHQSNGLRLYLF